MNQREFRTLLLVSSFLLLVFFTGCTTTDEQEDSTGVFKSQITLFLNGPDKSSLDITFDLLSVNIITEEGLSRKIMDTPVSINSIDVTGRQIVLGERALPAGKYKKIQLVVRQPLVKKKGKQATLALPPEGIDIDINVTVKRNQNTTLFLNWNADASITDGYLFNPVFIARGQTPELSSLLIYVTNEDSDNVSVINRQSGEVAATIMSGKRPRGIAVSQGGERLKVYVANSGSNSISVIDPTTNKLESEIPIRFGRQPEGIAVTRISPDTELIYVTNFGSDNVSVFNAATYEELEKVKVGRSPIAVSVDPSVDTLLRARSLSFEDINILRSYREKFFNVYVVNYDSNDISVLKVDIRSMRTVEVITLGVEWRPISLDIDYPRGKIFVANYNSNKLSVIDILKIIKGDTTGAVTAVANVGTLTTGVIADPTFNRIYLLKERPGEVVIFRPFTEEFDTLKTIMPPIVGTVSVGDLPRAFILDPEGRKLYVVNRGSDNISVIDKTSRREEEVIPVGRRPYGIAIFSR